MISFLKNTIVKVKRLFKKKDYLTKQLKTNLTKPSLAEISKKVLEEEKKTEKIESELKEKIQNFRDKEDKISY